jgi:uncharacterized cupredoxin-like copper-binding protein
MNRNTMLAAAAVALMGCTMRGGSAAAPLVTITAHDYGFQLPATVPAGPVRLELVNQGRELHHTQLMRLAPGKTVAAFQAAIAAGHEQFPDWAVPMGGPNGVEPGDRFTTVQVLPPGEYVVLCIIPSPDGVLHLAKGMMASFRAAAVEGALRAAPASRADVTYRLRDYSFTGTGRITPGRRTIRVVNDAEQWRELVLARLEPGKTAHDLLTWAQSFQGPPPGRFVGGVSGLARGEEAVMAFDFTPGSYVLLCFMPDATDGLPHVAHGMVQELLVEPAGS